MKQSSKSTKEQQIKRQGNKILENKNQFAGPASYTIPSVFDMNKFKKKGVNMRISRSQAIKTQNLTENPGPGKYHPKSEQSSIYTCLPKFTIGAKFEKKNKESIVPDPGRYEHSISLVNSKFTNRGNTLINPITTNRFTPFQKQVLNSTTEWRKLVEKFLQ